VKWESQQGHIGNPMKLPNFRRIFSNDFKEEYKELLDGLSGTVNTGIEVLYNALNNNLTFKDNFAATVAEVSIRTDASGTPIGGATFRLSNSLKVEGLIVISAINSGNASIYPTGGVFLSFLQSNQTVSITNATGLVPGQTYTVKVIALN